MTNSKGIGIGVGSASNYCKYWPHATGQYHGIQSLK